ncbi:hypothetical protein MRQ36_11195 [Micromonospora sp. R77]|uniref:hypothetical protein n=1 Tax=Micromonospora sp. R77 TaxID=2925836 RepID=UPI001F6181B5|nr:hypothetical protein [Micromonospora sp. R77]MCI4063114.1 hypothetical protein [Micromonospora sp. R77]
MAAQPAAARSGVHGTAQSSGYAAQSGVHGAPSGGYGGQAGVYGTAPSGGYGAARAAEQDGRPEPGPARSGWCTTPRPCT